VGNPPEVSNCEIPGATHTSLIYLLQKITNLFCTMAAPIKTTVLSIGSFQVGDSLRKINPAKIAIIGVMFVTIEAIVLPASFIILKFHI
jgi:hypothetical protein